MKIMFKYNLSTNIGQNKDFISKINIYYQTIKFK